MKEKDIILFVGNVPDKYIIQIKELEKKMNCSFRIALIADFDTEIKLSSKYRKTLSWIGRCNTENEKNVEEKLKDIKNEILITYFVYERYAVLYCKVLKIVKLKNNPPIKSIRDSTNKIEMRKAFYKCDPDITPKFIQIKNKNSVNLISKKVGFPCMLKPSGLSRSRLITASNNPDELGKNLNEIFSKIEKIYKKEKIKTKPLILAEEKLEGKMYTVDVYVDNKQKIHFTPFIYQITAKELGIDDFHIFGRVNPSGLNEKEIKKAKLVAKKGVLSLGLKNVIVHFEFMKTKNGWKIIEVGPRIGAYRIEMLDMSYGIRHFENYLLLRLNKKPIVNNNLISHSAFLEFFPRKRGYVRSMRGINKIRKLKSFSGLAIKNEIGSEAGLSKNGYLHTLRVILKNKNKKIFYKDIETAKGLIKIETSKSK